MTLIIFNIICDYFKCVRSTRFLIMSGQNPMIAYVATDLLIYPILNILGITPLLKYFYSSPWLGFLHGIILTSLTVFITMFLLVSNGIGELKIKDETIVSFIKYIFQVQANILP